MKMVNTMIECISLTQSGRMNALHIYVKLLLSTEPLDTSFITFIPYIIDEGESK